jgi:hypothetical protein
LVTRPDVSRVTLVEGVAGGVPTMKAKWEQEVRGCLRTEIRNFSRSLTDLIASGADEDKTRYLVTEFLREGLGFDVYEDLTVEGESAAAHGVRVDRQLVAFIEVKRCTQKLNMRHLCEVQMYAVNEGVEWIILTNGQVWQAYHLTGGLPIIIDRVLEVDLLGDGSAGQKADGLFYLSKEALRRRLLDDLWKTKAATTPRSLSEILLSDALLDALRKELRRQTGYNGDIVDLARIIRADVIRADAL